MKRALLIVIVALAAVMPLAFGSGYAISLLTQMAILTIFAMSYSLLLGETGLLSFGHAAYYGAGAFGTIHFLRAIDAGLPVPVVLAPLAGAACALAAGIVAGALITRRSGTAFAMITLGIGELVHATATMFKPVFGGEEGISASRTGGPGFLGFVPANDKQVYVMVLVWLLIAGLGMFAITRTPLGRMANACRDNPERVAFVGYDPRVIRFMMFSVAAMFAGIAGGLNAVTYEIVTTEVFSAKVSTDVVLMTFIGGVGHLLGPVLGAILVTLIQSLLSLFSDAWQLYYGILFIVFVLFAPNGFVGAFKAQAALIARGPAAWPVITCYGRLVLPGVIFLVGAIILIECAYRSSSLDTHGGTLTLFARQWSSSDPRLLAAAAVAVIGGGYVVHRMAGRLRAAWIAAFSRAEGESA